MTSSSRIIIWINRIVHRFDDIRILSFFIDNDEQSTSDPSRRVRFHHFHFTDSPGFPSPSDPLLFPFPLWLAKESGSSWSSFSPLFHQDFTVYPLFCQYSFRFFCMSQGQSSRSQLVASTQPVQFPWSISVILPILSLSLSFLPSCFLFFFLLRNAEWSISQSFSAQTPLNNIAELMSFIIFLRNGHTLLPSIDHFHLFWRRSRY